jgi:hypothetical protein
VKTAKVEWEPLWLWVSVFPSVATAPRIDTGQE